MKQVYYPGLPSHPQHELAVSLGDVATLIQHSASMTHASIPREQRLAVGITDGLLRISVGIERAEDIIEDLETALRNVQERHAMQDSEVTITKATRADLFDLLALLTRVELPHDGVAEHLHNFFVARDQKGQLIGSAGLERYGSLGLLRSVAVAPEYQQTGLGSRMTATLLDYAAQQGIADAVLLTTTARDFFANRFGFKEACRDDFNERLAQSEEWALPRCSSAACMHCEL